MRQFALSTACLGILFIVSACSTTTSTTQKTTDNITTETTTPSTTLAPTTALPTTPVNNTPSLTGIIWKVDRVDETPVLAADSRSAPFIQLDKQKATLTGYTGCNRIFGQFTESTNNTLKLQVASTKMACIDAEKQQLENKIQHALNETTSYQFKDKQLSFYDAKQQERLIFNNAGNAAAADVPPANAQSNSTTAPQS